MAVFLKKEPLTVKAIYEIEPEIMVAETERKLDISQNQISHIGFSENWAKANGRVVYQHKA